MIIFKKKKDRLYCESSKSHKRLSAQTALNHVLVNSLVLLAPIMPHLSEEAFHHSFLNKKYPTGLFRSGLRAYTQPEWLNEDIEKSFRIINKVREDFNTQVGSGNVALYKAELTFDQSGMKLIKSFDTEIDWLVEIFACSSVHLRQAENNNLQTDQKEAEGIKYSVRASLIDQNSVFACARCRRHILGEKSDFCQRCKDVINS